jgi:hypothetical protein
VAIEPWADLEILSPDSKAEFYYDDPATIEFSVIGNGEVCVGVISGRVRVIANSGEKTFNMPGRASNRKRPGK